MTETVVSNFGHLDFSRIEENIFFNSFVSCIKRNASSSYTGLEFCIWVIEICTSTWLRVVGPSTLLRTLSLLNGLSNHLLLVVCNLGFHSLNVSFSSSSFLKPDT